MEVPKVLKKKNKIRTEIVEWIFDKNTEGISFRILVGNGESVPKRVSKKKFQRKTKAISKEIAKGNL